MSKSVKVLLAAAIILTFAVGATLAAGLPNLPGAGASGGSKLTKQTKSFTLADLDASLKPYMGQPLDPVKADKKYACDVFGDADYDKVAIAVTKTELANAFANNVLQDANAKIDAAKTKDDLKPIQNNLEVAQKVATIVSKDDAALTAGIPGLLSGLAAKAKSDPLGYGKNLADMSNVAKKLPDLAKSLQATGKLLADTLTKASARAASLAK